jgi:hypothetical protein
MRGDSLIPGHIVRVRRWLRDDEAPGAGSVLVEVDCQVMTQPAKFQDDFRLTVKAVGSKDNPSWTVDIDDIIGRVEIENRIFIVEDI